ncbi:MAG: hypothetical protein JNK10_05010 [Cyclobacteriaceae bacterium]|nr:hypothetical protein [Cyclobacteriaceae bacterium]
MKLLQAVIKSTVYPSYFCAVKRTSIFIIFCLLGISCSKDESSPTQQELVSNILTSASWNITYQLDNGVDQSGFFDGSVLTFGTKTAVTGTSGTTIVTGSWEILDTDSQVDALEDLRVVFNFSTPPFDDLNRNWQVTALEQDRVTFGLPGSVQSALIIQKK